MFQKFTGLDYLRIDIANNFGLDKKNWDERLEWFKENEQDLYNMQSQAAEPALFYAGLKAYQAALDGQASGYPISLDATSSGLQILAALTGDRLAASICNVIDTGKREDAYTVIYERMLGKLGEGARIKRDDCKNGIMTSLYGSKAQPKAVFGEGLLLSTFFETMNESAPAAWQLNEAYLDMWDPEALVNQWVLPDNFHVRAKVMSLEVNIVHFLNAPVEITREINAPTEEGRSLCANTTHSIDGMIVREMTRRCNYDSDQVRRLRRIISDLKGGYRAIDPDLWYPQTDEQKNDDKMVATLWQHFMDSGYLSARIIDHLNSDNIKGFMVDAIDELLNSLPAKPFQVLSVHDCFRCLPNYGNDLRWQYNYQLYCIARSNLLEFMLSQILHKEVPIVKFDPTLHEDILQSNYALS